MVSRVTIEPATLRDASYIMANLCERDREEVMCQVPEGTKMHEMAYNLLMGSDAYAARLRGNPVTFFGTSMINVACRSVWALGTDDMIKTVPAITRFFANDLLPLLIAEGYHTMEARSLITHQQAHRWMLGTGAKVSGEPFEYGRNREKFLLFRWTADTFEANKAKHGARRHAV